MHDEKNNFILAKSLAERFEELARKLREIKER